MDQDDQPTISISIPDQRYVCDRCGFRFRAGSFWVIDGVTVYFCRDCQADIDHATGELAATQKLRFIEALMRRLGVSTGYAQEGRLDATTAAALLGFRE
jgi:DNA-directed RNA polymerase subunit RPC12/RpoP